MDSDPDHGPAVGDASVPRLQLLRKLLDGGEVTPQDFPSGDLDYAETAEFLSSLAEDYGVVESRGGEPGYRLRSGRFNSSRARMRRLVEYASSPDPDTAEFYAEVRDRFGGPGDGRVIPEEILKERVDHGSFDRYLTRLHRMGVVEAWTYDRVEDRVELAAGVGWEPSTGKEAVVEMPESPYRQVFDEIVGEETVREAEGVEAKASVD